MGRLYLVERLKRRNDWPLCEWRKVIWQIAFRLSSVQFSRSVTSDSLRPHESQRARPPCPSPTPGVHSNSRPPSRWCHPAISSSVVPFSSCPQSLPASESFPMSQLFAWGGKSTGVSALASFLPNRAALMHGSWAYWPILQIFDFAVIITWAIPYDKYVSLCFCLSFHISVSPSPSSPLHMCIWKPLTNTDSYLSG